MNRWVSKILGAVVTLLIFLWTGLVSILLIFLFPFISWRRKWVDGYIRTWSLGCLKIAGIQLDVKGGQNLPEEGVIFVFNHLSLFDIPTLFWALPKSVRFGAKIELFRIPFFGFAMKLVGILPIDRHNREKAIGALNEARRRLSQGESFILAPEGTRQRVSAIGEFKSGPFVLGIQAQASLVPVVLAGTNEVISKESWLVDLTSPRVVSVQILNAVDLKGRHIGEKEQIKEEIRHHMVSAFLSLQASRSRLHQHSPVLPRDHSPRSPQ